MKGKSLFAGLALVVGLLLVRPAAATINWGWADEFLGATVDCNDTSPSTAACTIQHMWKQDFTEQPPTWETIGNQGTDSTGRSNAREKIMFRFREVATGNCMFATTNLARYRTASPPAVGSSCSTSVSFVGSVSQTFDSCGFPVSDGLINMRMLPVYNFSSETATGSTIGYQSNVTVTVTGPNNTSLLGCYSIHWL